MTTLSDPLLYSFLAGFGGSLAVEVIVILNHFERAKSSADIPWQYRDWRFWVMRVLLALMGGALAALYKVNNIILAIQIGASAPAFVLAAARVRSNNAEATPQQSETYSSADDRA